MTPKEKAIELFNKYATYIVMWTGGMETEKQNCKQCALIAVDEMIKNQNEFQDFLWKEIGYLIPSPTYWQEVKQEIDKL